VKTLYAAPMVDAATLAAHPGVREDLGWALGVVVRAYVRAADAELSDLPGGPRGYRLLCAVARDCPASQLALAHTIGLDRTVVTYLLDDLAAAGLVERQPDPADRRTRRVVATGGGRALLADADARLAGVEARLLDDLAPSEAETFRSLVQRVAVRLHDQGSGALTCPGAEALATS